MPRTSRKGGASSSSRGGGAGAGPHTPAVSTPSGARVRTPSPLSPVRITRDDEKKEMRNLNDRLAHYIETVRNQQVEIRNLQHEVSTIEETKSTEVVTLKNAYNREIEILRKNLDDTAKDKAKLEISSDKYEKEARELRAKLKEKEKALDSAERELVQMQNRYSSMQTDLTKAEKEANTLRPENAKLLKKLDDAKRNLEDETVKRIDLQNQLQTMQEGLKFENSLLEQQLNETKTRKSIEISELDGKLQKQYDDKLAESLADLRNTYEQQAKENKAMFKQTYDEKLQKLQAKLDEERIERSGSVQELREFETKVSGLTSRNIELEAANQSLSRRMAEMLEEMEAASKQHRQDMARKDAEVRNKEEQMQELLKDYQALTEIKVALDMEIAAYRKMLESEESRLGLSPGSPGVGVSSSSSSAPSRGVKRKRTTILEELTTELVSEHSGRGTIAIEPLDKDGKFIAVLNKSDAEVNIGGWTLVNVVNGDEVKYKFHRTTTLEPGDVCKVWSADADTEHSPPLNLQMKKGGWIIGDENETVLTNKEGDEESRRQSRKERSQSGSVRYGTSQLYGQAGENKEGCVVM